MFFFAHAHTVDTRPLFSPPTRPGNVAKAKGTLQNSTIFVNVFRRSKWIFKFIQGSYMLYGGQKPTLQTFTGHPHVSQNFKLLQATYRITMVKTEYPRFYKHSTSIAVSNTDFQNFYKLPIRLAEVTYHCGGQYGHYKIQQGCGMLCSGENRHVQPSITHCWGHN